jgi:hypothetical protein
MLGLRIVMMQASDMWKSFGVRLLRMPTNLCYMPYPSALVNLWITGSQPINFCTCV